MPVPNVAVVPRATLKLLPRISSQHDQYHPSFYGTFRISWNLTVRTSLWQTVRPRCFGHCIT